MNWDDNICANATTASSPSLDEMRRCMMEMELQRKSVLDVIVMTFEEYEWLKRQLDWKSAPQREMFGVSPVDTVYGIRIERYPTKGECRVRMCELAMEGKRVGFVDNGAVTGNRDVAS